MPTAQSNVEKYLAVIAGHDEEIPTQPASRVEWYLNEILQNGGGGGGGGTTNYNALSNKPRVNGTELSGNKTAENLGLVPNTREINGKPLSENVTLNKSDIGLDNVDNTSDADKPISNAAQTALNLKVDKVAGKGLSTEDYTSAEKTKLSGIETGATATVIDVTLSKTGEAADAKTTGNVIADLQSENALLRELISGIDAPIYRKASGAPATFADGYDNATLKSLSVTITPTQSGTPSVETPITIAGYDNVTITRTGRNLYPILIGADTWTRNSGASWTNENGTLKISVPANSGLYAGVYATASGQLNPLINAQTQPYVVSFTAYADITAPFDFGGTGTKYRISVGTSPQRYSVTYNAGEIGAAFTIYQKVTLDAENALYVSDFMLEVGDAVTEYESYRGQAVDISLSSVGTVYGGILDAIGGTLSVTHGQIASYNGETVPDGWISSTGELSTGAQVVYPLASPLSHSLTSVSLTSLLGYNCVFADAGTIAVNYRADTQITLGG